MPQQKIKRETDCRQALVIHHIVTFGVVAHGYHPTTYNYHCIINFFNLPLSFICTHLIWVHPQEPVVEILKCDYLKSFLW